MRARLITNGALSVITSILWIISIVSLYKSVTSTVSFINSDDNGSALLTSFSEPSSGAIFSFAISYFLIFITWFVNVIMGIITLSMEKHEKVIGLTIASGIIAILGGLFIVNAIVSFIAVFQISKEEPIVE